MDGYSLKRDLRTLLLDESANKFYSDRVMYYALHLAAIKFVQRTECLKTAQTITTAASTSDYDLNPDFMGLHLKDSQGNWYARYYAPGTTSNPYIIFHRDYERIVYADNSTASAIPSSFSIKNNPTQDTNISGTATSAGTLNNGESALNDTGASFESYINVGDELHNTTDDTHGYVLEVTSDIQLQTAIFDSTGTAAAWGSGDAYLIKPQPKNLLVLDPASSTASYSLIVDYVQRPAPVYSSYRGYNISNEYSDALVFYAAWYCKYIDREPNFSDRLYTESEKVMRMASMRLNRTFRREGFKVNFMKAGSSSGSYR